MPSAGATPIEPPFFAYSGQRGMRRVLLDLKDADGRDAFFALSDAADVIVESFRPGVVERLGIGYEAVRRATPAWSTAPPPGTARTGRTPSGPGTTSTTSPWAGTWP